MFNNKKNKKNTGLELVMDILTDELKLQKPGSDEYSKIVDQLDRLNKIATSRKSAPVSVDGLIAVAGNLAGIGLIIHYEQLHTITTKAVNFVLKAR